LVQVLVFEAGVGEVHERTEERERRVLDRAADAHRSAERYETAARELLVTDPALLTSPKGADKTVIDLLPQLHNDHGNSAARLASGTSRRYRRSFYRVTCGQANPNITVKLSLSGLLNSRQAGKATTTLTADSVGTIRESRNPALSSSSRYSGAQSVPVLPQGQAFRVVPLTPRGCGASSEGTTISTNRQPAARFHRMAAVTENGQAVATSDGWNHLVSFAASSTNSLLR
jgi:hypothetical protein